MKTLIACELKKLKGRYFYIMLLACAVIQLFWSFYGHSTPDTLKHGWMLNLYQLPLVNAIFLPFVCTIAASRLCDTEHKGVMLKQLCTIAPKGKIYDAKLFFGTAVISFFVLFDWIATIAVGKCKGFAGSVPMGLYLRYLLFTLIPAIEIYIVQHTLALCFKNQAVGFFVGIIGEFIGVFALFLPSVPLLRQLLPWGHFAALDFVGMYGWTQETRMKNIWFEIIEIEPAFIAALTAAIIILYFIGRNLFVRKEL